MTSPSLAADVSRLGRVQRMVLGRLASSPQGLITPDLDDLARQSSLSAALRGLECRGLAEVTGAVLPEGGRGAPFKVWSATKDGRKLAGGAP